LPEGAQCLPRGYILEASDSNVGKRHKQAEAHEKVNDDRLKRDGAALIRYERTFLAHKPISTVTIKGLTVKSGVNRVVTVLIAYLLEAGKCTNKAQKRTCTHNDEHGWKQEQHHRNSQLGA
jgi:hypothetical protein